jgi:Fic family protein
VVIVASNYQTVHLPLPDKQVGFYYVHLDDIESIIKQIDDIAMSDVVEHLTKGISTLNVLIDESYYSSKIEGAFSTRRQAKEVIKTGQANTHSERMILNNYNALEFVIDHLNVPISKDGIVQLQQLITKDTLSPEDITDGYRTDKVYVEDVITQEIVHVGPDHSLVPVMMESLFDFIENTTLNPLVVASLLHFYIGYVHPFFDGNGRVARSTMYWYLMSKGYSFFQLFSISQKYEYDKNYYYQAFLDTEESGDVTHFVLMNVVTIWKAIQDALKKVERYSLNVEIKRIIQANKIVLTKNQKKLLKYAVNSGGNILLSHKKIAWWSSEEEARSDIEQLVVVGLLKSIEDGKAYELNVEMLPIDNTTEINISFVEDVLFDLLVNNVPSELNDLATHVFIESIDNVEIRSLKVLGEEVRVSGLGTINVELHYGIIHKESFVFTFWLEFNDDTTVSDYEIEVDTEEFNR